MGKQVRKVLILTAFVTSALFGGAMTSYAVGPGEGASQTAVAKPTTYNQQAVKALGSWEQQENIWKFKCLDGNYLTNSWLESLSEAGAFFYVNTDGIMLINANTPDGYSIDGNGIWRVQSSVATNVADTDSNINTGNQDNYVKEITPEQQRELERLYTGISSYDGAIH